MRCFVVGEGMRMRGLDVYVYAPKIHGGPQSWGGMQQERETQNSVGSPHRAGEPLNPKP